ncbi:helix-turn-helix domain-containing protein [Halococcus thailandensis]|uniref:DNA binding domain-containing protein n=1 Tax=Halococcus thailandensis JCM 13552 TaxID=1227457 RepID=M0N4Y0_9EURY|nr:helix-turn-helix domain-containing protein [Halococcus thailandensis]EMA52174.1 DNA binding domain-containing protein [Halococcus thailandensis JCM 13552]
MSTIGELSVAAETFALGETIERVPEATFDVERVVAHDADRVMPFVWASAPDREALEDAFAADASVDNVERLSDLDGEWLYRMEWVARVQFVVHALLEEQATVLNAESERGRWQLRLLFPDRDSLSRTYDFCREHDIDIDVDAIYAMENERHARFGLTEEQAEALNAAFEHGYYEVPRDLSVADLADELDISHQALSERFRRAHGNLVESTLIVNDEETEPQATPDL